MDASGAARASGAPLAGQGSVSKGSQVCYSGRARHEKRHMDGVVLVDVGDHRFEIGAQLRVGNCRARSGVRWETGRGRDKGQAKVRSFPYVHRHARSKSDHCSRENVGGGPAARSGLRRPLLRRGQDHRRLLPAELQVAPGEARERPLLFDRRSGGAGWISRLQALPPRPPGRDGPSGRGGAARMRTDCRGRGSALARRPRRRSGAEPFPLPSRLQEGDRRDAQGLCRRGAGAARRREAPDRQRPSPRRSTTPGSTLRAASTRPRWRGSA